ncbi:hypothetical protein H0H93_008440 [Arthromyces matolae]|nr:hypothetical protein H0H93_008440 [Arthromyces matolae]
MFRGKILSPSYSLNPPASSQGPPATPTTKRRLSPSHDPEASQKRLKLIQEGIDEQSTPSHSQDKTPASSFSNQTGSQNRRLSASRGFMPSTPSRSQGMAPTSTPSSSVGAKKRLEDILRGLPASADKNYLAEAQAQRTPSYSQEKASPSSLASKSQKRLEDIRRGLPTDKGSHAEPQTKSTSFSPSSPTPTRALSLTTKELIAGGSKETTSDEELWDRLTPPTDLQASFLASHIGTGSNTNSSQENNPRYFNSSQWDDHEVGEFQY